MTVGELALMYNGEKLWGVSEQRGISLGSVYLEKGQTVQGEIDKANKDIESRFLSNIPPLPPRIVKAPKQVFGVSTITSSGLQPFTGQVPEGF